MHPVLKIWWDSVKVAAGHGPLIKTPLFWAVTSSIAAIVLMVVAAGAPWQTLAIIPGMLAGALWFVVFFQVAHHSADALLAFVGGLFLLAMLVDIILRFLLR